MTVAGLGAVVAGTRAILLDFDGPVCGVFAGHPSTGVAERIRQEIAHFGVPTTDWDGEHDPLMLLRRAALVHAELYAGIEAVLRHEEGIAVESARHTPGVLPFLEACRRSGRPVVVVTNNSRTAVEYYLQRQAMTGHIGAVFARDRDDPALMKPDPHLVNQAVRYLRLPAESCSMVGDSETDVMAARAAGARCIGFANKPGKLRRLHSAGADAVVTSIQELTRAIDEWCCVPAVRPAGS